MVHGLQAAVRLGCRRQCQQSPAEYALWAMLRCDLNGTAVCRKRHRLHAAIAKTNDLCIGRLVLRLDSWRGDGYTQTEQESQTHRLD